ncbi:LysE family translocator [Kiloniella sp. EL199]|uniref:LysE family translocator n=1 Tax=Kiloniella sp. EL199 TaxID=2107581 RepID=UPI000EA00803|nr:LysE family translocator [Kiloniella sp. EL199]
MSGFQDILPYLSTIIVSYLAYLVATISPGPANLAIMSTSMSEGRKPGLLLASGVIMGSLTWGILAAIGLSNLLSNFAWLMTALRIVGGLYLLWLACKSLKSALGSQTPKAMQMGKNNSGVQYFLLGLGIHLTNPKSIFAWLSIIAVGIKPDAPTSLSFIIVGECTLIGVLVFVSYALAFSTKK